MRTDITAKPRLTLIELLFVFVGGALAALLVVRHSGGCEVTRKVAEENAADFARDLGLKPKAIRCMDAADDDGYVQCELSFKDGSTYSYECGGSLSLVDGCRSSRGAMRP